MSIIGIYCIVNKVNYKKYVGSSINVKNKFRQHKHTLNNNKHCNKHLQLAWNKCKATNFEFNRSSIAGVASEFKKTYKGFKWSYTPLKK